MKRSFLASLMMLGLTAICVAQDPGWPRMKTTSAGKLIYYQPQIDDWINHKDIDFRLAFSLTPPARKTVVGVGTVHANTIVDVDSRTVLLTNPTITSTNFPSLDPATSAQMDQLLKTFLPPTASVTVSLDRLIAGARKSEPANTVPVRNDPPRIFVSNQPAMLLQVDGEPVFGDIKDTSLRFVINTNWPLFLDKSKSTYYLFTGQQWLTTGNLQAAWTATTKLPKDMSKLAGDPQWNALAAAITTPPASATRVNVFYSTVPAEVIIFKGAPTYAPIAGTNLVYATNTDGDVFVHSPSNQIYYLAAGRWFRASSLQGPWTFATDDLPPDFANIPLSERESRVLVSVPGTEASKDAVLLAQVPTTATVDPRAAAAQAKVEYDGPPQFKPIEGTSLSYATNTSDKVIKVGDVYYLCLQGVWFVSPNAQGPWTTANSVPATIYTIPPSSPVYNVTYVTQTTANDGTVTASYTAGYVGSFVVGATVGAVLACGTGYYYPPYVYAPIAGYPIYRPYAATYGWGSYYNSYTGAYGVARGVYGPYGGAGGFASYNPYTGTYARGATAYGPYGSASAARAYNPYTGTYARGASVSTPYGTRSAAQAYNPYTGNAAATRQGSSAYGQWGSSVVSNGNQAVQTGHAVTNQGAVAGARSTSGAAAVGGVGQYNSGGAVKTSSGDMYAAKDRNVYKNTGGSWQKYDNGNWNSVSKPASYNSAAGSEIGAQASQRASAANRPQMTNSEFQGLNQEFQNRQRGAFQADQFQNFQRSGGFGGGGFSGGRSGGGGRRR